MVQKREKYLSFAVCMGDMLSLVIAFILANWIWLDLYRGMDEVNYDNIGILLATFMFVFFLFSLNRYFLKRSKVEELMNMIKNTLLLAAISTLVLYITKNFDSMNRGVFACTLIFYTALGFGIRVFLKSILRKYFRKNMPKMLLVTTSDRVESIIRSLNSNYDLDSRVVAVALIDQNRVGETIESIPVVAGFFDMLDYTKKEVVDEVFIHVSYDTGRSLKPVIEEFEKMGVTVHININVLDGFDEYNKSINMLGSYPVVSFATKFFDSEKLVVKRLIDIIGGLIGGVITLIAALILLPIVKIESPGPLFFKQKRVGKNGRYFYIYKFRSMYMDAEERKKDLMSQNEMKGLMFKMKDDPRITKVGKFIRATSIDELPQFFNVLKGDMSLVGTRPPTVDEFRQYELYHKRRLSIKPGITGMWQVSGRSDIEDFEEVVRLDLYYIDNWSLALDVKILCKTVAVVFGKVGSR